MEHHIEISPLLDQTPLNEATPYESSPGPQLPSPSPAVAASFFAFAVSSHQVIPEDNEADYIIEIKTAEAQDQLGLQTKQANQMVDEGSSTESCTIFKVNVGLRESNPDAYTPKLISIGPYHKKNRKLRTMEKYKLRYQQRFLRRKLRDVDFYIKELEKLKEEAFACYDDIGNLDNDHSSRKFVEMLFLDGCFVVEYIREFYEGVPEGEDKIISAAWMESLVDRDLLLLENQLPFFILTELHSMTTDRTDVPFIQMVKYNFGSSLPKVTPKFISQTDDDDKEIKHLLEVVHLCCCPPDSSVIWNPTKKLQRPMMKSFCWNPLQTSRHHKKLFKTKDGDVWHDRMRSATELDEAGIKFSNVGKIYRKLNKDNKEDAVSLFDIKFEKAVMEIPCFEVVNSTETILRNLIAYEQHTSDVHPRYFTDYVIFMDYLINSNKDVNLLRMNGIIRNRIGDDQEVAIMFNKLGEGVIPSTEFYYKEECRKVVEHCEKPWNENMANLRRNYLSSPWAKISTAAAIVLLLLTVAQTVLAFISTL